MDELTKKLMEERQAANERYHEVRLVLKERIYYIVIFVVSLISLGIVPFLQSTIDGSVNMPTTPWGWVMYMAPKILTSAINVVIYIAFMRQAKVNVKDEKSFVEANALMSKTGRSSNRKRLPRNPAKWKSGQYASKILSLTVSTFFGMLTIGSMILNFDWTTFIASATAVIMGVVFGFMQMFDAMDYWTTEYLDYAKMAYKKAEEKNNGNHD